MSTTDSPTPAQPHGITYPPSFLQSLRVLTPRPSPHQPIRLLPLSDFADIHLRSLLNHAPDNVLFPFLHGLEGSNQAQNTFFQMSAVGGYAATRNNNNNNNFGSSGNNNNGNASGNTNNSSLSNSVIPPYFRGLIWVVCEEDLDDYVNSHNTSHSAAAARGALEGHSHTDKYANGSGTHPHHNPNGMDMEEELDDDFYSSGDDDDDDDDDDDEDSEEYSMECAMDADTSVGGAGVLVAMDVDVDMQVDGGRGDSCALNNATTLELELRKVSEVADAHMHPVHHRGGLPSAVPPPSPPALPLSSTEVTPTSSPAIAIKTPSPTTTTTTLTTQAMQISPSSDTHQYMHAHDRRPSNASSLASVTSSSDADTDTDAFSVSTSATSYAPCSAPGSGSVPASPVCSSPGGAQAQSQATLPAQTQVSSAVPPTAPQQQQQNQKAPHSKITKKSKIQPAGPPPLPLLTSTFRPKDLLRTSPLTTCPSVAPNNTNGSMNVDVDGSAVVDVGAGEPEFVPPKVPAGISLRNFGIQVPVYATLSDIVIYSPKGLTRASMALAERFKVAVERKAAERRMRLRGAAGSGEGDGEDGLIAYNVFVLDATAEEMMEKVPYLMMRLQGATDEEESSSPTTLHQSQHHIHNAHTVGQDGQTSGETGNAAEVRARKPNTIDFALREKEEMRDLTRASEIISIVPVGVAAKEDGSVEGAASVDFSGTTTATHWDPMIGQVFLGNSGDVPLIGDSHRTAASTHARRVANGITSTINNHLQNSSQQQHDPSGIEDENDPFSYLATNDPAKGFGYDICVECHEVAPFPSTTHLRAADEHLQMLDALWAERNGRGSGETETPLPVRPPPNANTIIHLPFPSSPPSTAAAVASLLPFVKFLERILQPVTPSPSVGANNGNNNNNNNNANSNNSTGHSRRWSSVSALMPSFPSQSYQGLRSRSSTSPSLSSCAPRFPKRTRPLKILIYSPDGYTESSVPALCLLMAIRGLSLPEAYLELQVVKKRSFFVYENDLGVLRGVEGRLQNEREQERATGMSINPVRPGFGASASVVRSGSNGSSVGRQTGWKFSHYVHGNDVGGTPGPGGYTRAPYHSGGRPAANSISMPAPPQVYYNSSSVSTSASASGSFNYPFNSESSTLPPIPPPMVVPSQSHLVKSRPRASTSPWLPSLFGDHHSWFNDPRFDGSFPSRVLPFLYLGNLNHASNAYMLHALGITHVVSVGECALVPPPHHEGRNSNGEVCARPARGGAHFVAGKGPGGQGSLWIEEREGRIKVLDIQGVCDDGIDTLEPQLEPICDWIEKARKEGGQVLVHCRVGVSRSATVTIAYVMKHLGLPLVDAYLIVRSRRLSVLIQPNMRLLYNLCGWEIKLARERAGDDEEQLKYELARTLSWPYLAREVHSLNEKYLT